MGVFGTVGRGYTWQVPTDPSKGGGNPAMHNDRTAPETAPNRAAANQPGGWQPDGWGGYGTCPTSSGPRPEVSHYASGSHFGDRGRGEALPDQQLANSDRLISIQNVAETMAGMGSGGAAHGGVRPTGSSLPWANPLGIRLGRRRTPLAVMHGAGQGTLHFNQPRLRPFPNPTFLHERNSPFPGASPSGVVRTSPFNPMMADPGGKGLQTPHLRRILRPNGDQSYHAIEVDPTLTIADSGPIGGEWAR